MSMWCNIAQLEIIAGYGHCAHEPFESLVKGPWHLENAFARGQRPFKGSARGGFIRIAFAMATIPRREHSKELLKSPSHLIAETLKLSTVQKIQEAKMQNAIRHESY